MRIFFFGDAKSKIYRWIKNLNSILAQYNVVYLFMIDCLVHWWKSGEKSIIKLSAFSLCAHTKISSTSVTTTFKRFRITVSIWNFVRIHGAMSRFWNKNLRSGVKSCGSIMDLLVHIFVFFSLWTPATSGQMNDLN